MNRLLSFIVFCVITACLVPHALAETIKLKSGNVIEAKVIEKTGDYIVIESPGGPLRYNVSEIDTINKQQMGTVFQGNDVVLLEGSLTSDKEDPPADPKSIYKQKLIQLLLMSKKRELDVSSQEMNDKISDLLKFTTDYPDSIYVKDVTFILQHFLFHKAMYNEDKERALNAISEIEKISSLYPHESLEELSCKIILAVYPEEIVYVPFFFAASYSRALLEQSFQNYESSIEYLTNVKDKFNSVTPGEIIFLQDVYKRLINAYILTNKVPESRAIMREAVKRFPNTTFAQELQNNLPDDRLWIPKGK